MDRHRWVFQLILCVSTNNLVQIQDESLTFAIFVGWNNMLGCCRYTYTDGKCYNASTHRLARRRPGGCDIQNIDKWNEVDRNIYQTFKVKATFQNGNTTIELSVLPCNDTEVSSSENETIHTSTQTLDQVNTTIFATFSVTTENNNGAVPLLVNQAANLNPANVDDLENIESLLQEVSRNVIKSNNISDYGNAQLNIEYVQHNKSKYNSNVTIGSTHINLTLQTTGVRRLVVAVFVFKINVTVNAQTQRVEYGSLATTRYIAMLNTTYIAILGWDADSFLSSRQKHSTAERGNNQLAGNVNFVVPHTPLKYFCKEIVAKKKHEPNLMINKLEPICLFFDRVEKQYSDRGCVTITDDTTGKVTCKCNHLTLFTVLLAVQATTIPTGVKVTSYATESTSIMFLVATIVLLYRSKHNGDRVPVQISLSLALLLFNAVNISHDLAVLNDVTCVMVTAVNHYLLLCLGMWFLVEGTRLFIATSFPVWFRTQDSSKRLKIFMLIGWILPALIVGLSMAVGFPFGFYMKPQPMYEHCNKFISILKYDRCWLAPGTPIFYATVVAPLALVLLINFGIVLKTTHVTLHSRKMRNRGVDPETADALRAAKSFILLFLMLGGTWVLAFFTGIGNQISNEVFMYIHSLVNGSQGIVVFLLYCVMDDDVRQEILSCKRKAELESNQKENEASAEGGESSNLQEG